MLYHQVAHSQNFTLLFQDHVEARALWDRVCQASPGLVAACLMPDHVHVYGQVDLFGQLDWESDEALEALWGAVSSTTRTPGERMWQRGEPRTLFIQAAKALTDRPSREIAHFCGASLRTVQRVQARVDDRVRLVGRVAGDSRFGPLQDLDTAALWRWVRRKKSRPRGPGPG